MVVITLKERSGTLPDRRLGLLRKSYNNGYRPPSESLPLILQEQTFHRLGCREAKTKFVRGLNLESILSSEHEVHDCVDELGMSVLPGLRMSDFREIKILNAEMPLAGVQLKPEDITDYSLFLDYRSQVSRVLVTYPENSVEAEVKSWLQMSDRLPTSKQEAANLLIAAFSKLFEEDPKYFIDMAISMKEERLPSSGFVTMDSLAQSDKQRLLYDQFRDSVLETALEDLVLINYSQWEAETLISSILERHETDCLVALLGEYYRPLGNGLAVLPFTVRSLVESHHLVHPLGFEDSSFRVTEDLSAETLLTMTMLFEKQAMPLASCYQSAVKLT